MDFDIIVDSTLLELVPDTALDPAPNKSLLSLVNDFEDGKWRFEKFQNFVWDNIAETALSIQERQALKQKPHTMLVEAAKKLRLTDSEQDISKGSELAEIFLYGIMKHFYGALSVVPKIFYKQNTQDYAKGADSVHIRIEAGNDFTLWFGEAKFYNSIEDARLNSIVQSVGNSLATDKLKKENSIVTNLSDLEYLDLDAELVESIKEALANKESIDSLKHRIHIPILLLHECELTAEATEISADYIEKVVEYHRDRAVAYFSRQIAALTDVYRYGEINFHLILFPVPEKNPIVEKFVETTESRRG